MVGNLCRGFPFRPSEAEENGVVPQACRGFSLRKRLLRRTDGTGNPHGLLSRALLEGGRLLGGKGENRPVQAVPGGSNGKLRRVHPDRNASRACIEIVTREGALSLFIEPAPAGQRQGMRGDCHPCRQQLSKLADVHVSEPPVPALEMRRLVEARPAPLSPVGHPLDELLGAHPRSAEELVRPRESFRSAVPASGR